MELVCLAAGFASLLLVLLLTPLARAAALRCGFVDRPGPRKIHAQPVACSGGWAVLAAFALATAVAAWWLGRTLDDAAWSAWRERLMLPRQVDAGLVRLLAICLAGALGAFALGLADDRWALRPIPKLLAQFLLAAAIVAGGVRLTALIGDNLITQAATVLWLVLVANSFNLLDNMDGLCAGTAAIVAGLLAALALQTGQAPVALVAAALAGACLGFLRYNLSPATLFLGNSGSMFIGFLLAGLTVITTYYHYRESPLSVGVPILILAIPLYDTASVVTIRFLQGRSLFAGDQSHFSHRLVDLGMTHRQAVATIHLAALAIGLPAVVIRRLSWSEGLLLVGQSLLILTVIALLERAGRLRRAGVIGGPPREGSGRG